MEEQSEVAHISVSSLVYEDDRPSALDNVNYSLCLKNFVYRMLSTKESTRAPWTSSLRWLHSHTLLL
jgi:hypothetical protein